MNSAILIGSDCVVIWYTFCRCMMHLEFVFNDEHSGEILVKLIYSVITSRDKHIQMKNNLKIAENF